jgi:cob(I)alamin adenosyltransferase
VKIYTRTGDQGETGLLGGARVPKDHVRIEAYGAIDELNAGIGLLNVAAAQPELERLLAGIQADLFEAGAELARPVGAPPLPGALQDADVLALEQAIDRLEADLPALTRFILPGGGEAAARAHLARCVCRRAERAVVRLLREEPSETAVLRYLNRLADLLFVVARWVNRKAGAPDVAWESRAKKPPSAP